MNKLQIVKTASSVVVGLGVGTIVNGIIRNNVATTTVIQNVTVTAASFAIGSMIGDATERHIHARIDQAADFIEKNFNKQISQ